MTAHPGLLLILACLVQGARNQVLIVVGTTAISADAHTHDCVNKGVQTVNDTSIFGGWIKNCKSGSSAPTEAPGGLPNPTGGKKYIRNQGESVTFICTVTGMKKNDTFAWISTPEGTISLPRFSKQGDNVITDPHAKEWYTFTSSNMTVWEMTINKIRKRDAGIHSCVVQSSRSGEMQSEKFNLDVMYPVEIHGVTPNDPPHEHPDEPNVLYFNETDNATMVCLSDGNPTPDTFWRRWDSSRNNLPSGMKLSLEKNLTIYNISVRDEGVYTCESRQLINAAVSNVTIKVQHKPILTEGEALVRKKKGSSVELVCNIDSDPMPATAAWYRGKHLITIGAKTTEHRSRLFITNLVPSKDYHNYTCVVANALGSSICHFEITGRPAKPTIISGNVSDKMHICMIEWTYEDYDITSEKRFLIYYKRKGNVPNDFVFLDEVIKFNPSNPMHYNTTIYDLMANATYYIELFAVNKYGQGDVETFEFRTTAVDKRQANNGLQKPSAERVIDNGSWMTSSSIVVIFVSLCANVLLPRA